MMYGYTDFQTILLVRRKKMRHNLFENCFVIAMVIFIAVVLAAFIAEPIISFNTISEFDGQLIRYVPEKDSNALMVIKDLSTGKMETFTNEDSLYRWKWNSRDLLALEEGATYHFKVNWFRSASILSQSRNVLSATLIGQ
ncbi:MAG: hypothetical protein UX08_C0017G0017 [Candidatus Collierbacteria bacterium GW2011_GWB1_45_35]|uniref:Uncharacterized protein n=2 Tax=Candidatus Collieribacteriota TaxID=1752725 RepID=A0A0G1MZR9_9BACT|nr:MAG: hypothetical protein UW48_C0009G0011 [Microgenomates group bacterium GW2011_GWC1_44_23]KKT86287.1 MAG: hypothetical protein UW84_C0013G0011 [Candidatus Collierbacteria bacterium GW2011_GWA2_44_99]KKT95240.1 MAG: hypothetical protein UW96_C0009G0011 [Candidatus Collierbacteria bacterium GW2011_GWA1_45_15]KKT99246.1 MAG: hypothetical protein UX01_C0011G0011 [Candidatus Collierbacteria bacterium GW2011_GWB2_45_17]KKU04759.1 MAG: hypothetical protein UX08_C0017G0017 [Candidatus Collierbacte